VWSYFSSVNHKCEDARDIVVLTAGGARGGGYSSRVSSRGSTSRASASLPVHELELHHAAPRCLLKLHDEAQSQLRLSGVGACLEFELEADPQSRVGGARPNPRARLLL
jgi:hypothetical protein